MFFSNKSRWVFFVLLSCVMLSAACRGTQTQTNTTGGLSAKRLTISKSAGPRTFNGLLAADEQTSSINACLTGRLIRINRQTQQPEAELAQAWLRTPDGRSLTVTLRNNLKFSDGQPCTADDVVFTFQLVNDPAIEATSADAFAFDGQRVRVEKIDAQQVRFVFPVPFAAAERLFDGVPILPKHLLESRYRAGSFNEAWTLATPPAEIAGLGPFKLKEYVAGQRVVLVRNEHYWKTDTAGARLPYLDELVFQLDADRNTQLLKFQQGETDLLSPVNADDAAVLETQANAKLIDLGPSLIRELFWFNLNDSKVKGKPLVDPVKLSWFKDVRFRQAVSAAVDRDAIVKLAFAGKAAPQSAFLSTGDKLWGNAAIPPIKYDLERAKGLLREAGFQWAAENELRDAQGHPVTFTLLTNAGNALRQKMSVLLQSDLAKLGIKVNLATLESRALLAKINDTMDYEACLLALVSGDADPQSHVGILASNGATHWWHPQQKQPATPWEARLDELMKQQATALDPAARKKLFDEAQQIMGDQQPFIFLASRHLLIAARNDIRNLKPALLPDFVLWNSDELGR